MKALLLAALCVPAFGQLQVFTLFSDTPAPAGPSVALGTVAIGDVAEFRFRAVNTGGAPLALQTISVSGASFSLATAFTAQTLGPAQSFEFSVRFAPGAVGSYSASLLVNSFSTLLRASAVAGPSLFLTNAGQTSELTASSLQVNIASGQSLTLALSVGNPHATPLTLTEIGVAGPGFSLNDPPPLPLTILPGETRPLPLTISAGAPGDAIAVLSIGARRFSIIAVIFRPLLAAPAILFDTPITGNRQQVKIRLQLAQPASGPGSGVLRAVFTGLADDPAILFSNGLREIPFEAVAGSREITFSGAPETVLQTGTTAGTLRLEAVTETGVTAETYRFERSAVVIEEARARRNGAAVEVEITGYDNVRNTGSLNFRFFDRAGNPMGGVITTTPVDQFRNYFAQSNLGGVFRLLASFPVTGDATIVGSVLVEIANSIGRTDLQRLTIP